MFILYMADLADVVQNCQVNFHSFADNLQIYLHCPLSGVPSAVRKLEASLKSDTRCRPVALS